MERLSEVGRCARERPMMRDRGDALPAAGRIPEPFDRDLTEEERESK